MVTITAILLTIFITIIIYQSVLFFLRYSRYRHLPGPTPLPLIGNLLVKDLTLKLAKFINGVHKTYGGLCVIWPGSSPVLVVSDPDLARRVFINDRVFVKGQSYERVFSCVFGRGLVTASGEKYKKDKSLLSRFFVRKHIVEHLPSFVDETKELIEVLEREEDGKVHDFHHHFLLLTLKMFTKFGLSYDIDEYKGKEKHLKRDLINETSWGSTVIGTAMFFDLTTNPILNPWIGRVLRLMKRMRYIISEIIEDRNQKKMKGDDPDDCLKVLLDSGMSQDDLNDHITTLISAGHDTTGFFECYIAYLLAKNPHVQKRAKEEIQQVLKGKDTITSDDLNQLKYLQCILKESLRLYSVIPTIVRITRDDTTLGKHFIPKGTLTVVPIQIMNKSSTAWEKPYEFNPDRFKDIPYEQSTKHGYFPFAYGQRSCIGSTLAMVEASVVFALLLQKFTLEPVEGFKPINPNFSVSMVTKNGMKIRVRKDNETAAATAAMTTS